MTNLDNIYLVILYSVLGLPIAIIRFIGFNVIALFQLKGTKSYKSLWSKDEMLKIFVHPYNILGGIILFLVVIFIDGWF